MRVNRYCAETKTPAFRDSVPSKYRTRPRESHSFQQPYITSPFGLSLVCPRQYMSSSSQLHNPVGHTLKRIAVTGYILLGSAVAFFALLATLWPESYGHVWKLFLAHLVAGRPGNIALGFEYGVPLWFLFVQCFIQGILNLFLLYPLVIAGYRRAVVSRILGATLAKVRTAADKYKSLVAPYGAIGLVLFVVFPLWSTGPLVGAVIGYLLGMRARVAFASVILGNLIAVAIWILFFDQLHALSREWARVFIVAIVVIALIATAVAQVRRLIRMRSAEDTSDTPLPLPVDDEPVEERPKE